MYLYHCSFPLQQLLCFVKIVGIKVCHFRHGEPKGENIGYYVWKRE